MTTLYLDLETYSSVPIAHGVHAYAEAAEILLLAWALDDGPVQVLDLANGEQAPAELRRALRDPAVQLCAHNAAFDRTLLRRCIPEFASDLRRWHCTMAQALAHSLPGSLGELCDLFTLPPDQAKDKEGRQLVLLFCKPRPASSKIKRATRETHPVEWAKFIEYARLDVEALRTVAAKLPTWNYTGEELALWRLDQRINDRGFAVDTALAEAAIATVARMQEQLAAQTQDLTDGAVQAATQRDAMLRHILQEHSVDLPDMQQATLQRRINDPDLPPAVRELLAIRLQASTTSTAKYKALQRATSSDGRLRGTLQFCGASRTGRWAGRLFQPQNIPRGNVNDPVELERGIAALKAGIADLLYE